MCVNFKNESLTFLGAVNEFIDASDSCPKTHLERSFKQEHEEKVKKVEDQLNSSHTQKNMLMESLLRQDLSNTQESIKNI